MSPGDESFLVFISISLIDYQ